jgi:hypothetical protein
MDQKLDHELSLPEPNPARKPYQRPQFRFESVFETRALTCGKVATTQATCNHNRKNS